MGDTVGVIVGEGTVSGVGVTEAVGMGVGGGGNSFLLLVGATGGEADEGDGGEGD